MPKRRLTLRSIHIVTTIERRPGVAGYEKKSIKKLALAKFGLILHITTCRRIKP
jgi:hypothetical protein